MLSKCGVARLNSSIISCWHVSVVGPLSLLSASSIIMLSLAILGLFAILLLLLYRYIIHPSFISPLSKIPCAHLTSSIIPIQVWSREIMSPNTHGVYAAHRKRGPVLRLGPNEISCASATALRTIYQGGFEKDRMYEDFFVNFGTPPMFGMLDSKPHSARKRLIVSIPRCLVSPVGFFDIEQALCLWGQLWRPAKPTLNQEY